ncbi:PAS domain-containing protein [Rhodospirillaceae bacterium KN72]|uniref:PAS domain-containing protein n=1 Tax=Pacificispira spongiicola TaxID=2729598 RepID=A0A7Y0E2Z3_9PROT|nr:PAS domain-containing protein [Pacificispira spongiicola]NMM46285.1 PAS domain-containing protein [Pacificispira spongiicola]
MVSQQISDIHPRNKDFADYWLSLPRDGLIPSRADFDPTDVPRLLPRFILHEVQDRKRIYIRLCGTALVRRHGADITGRDYLEFVPEERRAKALRGLLAAIDHPAGMIARMVIRTADGTAVPVESLGLPLLGKPDSVTGERPVLMLFHSVENVPLSYDPTTRTHLEEFGLSERIYLDIGNGTPAPFADEVYVESA